MKPIFFKELRECLRWAGIIFAVLLVIVLFRAWRTNPFYLFGLSQELTLLYAPLAGLAMGFAQSWFEIRADNWGFVVHRPVSRAAIFAAKCAAGLLMLYVSLAGACAIAVIWAMRPGNLPLPFQGRMVLPMTADILIGGCYYFAGMVLTLRRARWLGTRILPLGAPFICSVFVYLATYFWQAVAIIAVGQIIGAMAAWNCFSTAGATDRRSAPAVSLGIMLYCGGWLLGCVAIGILGAFESDTSWQELRVDQHGTVLQITKTNSDGDITYAVKDAAGKAVPEYDGMEMDDPANADRFVRFNDVLADERHLAWPFATMSGGGFHSARPGLLSLRTVAKPGATVSATPFFDRQDRIIKLYDPNTNLLIGSIGPNGFAARQFLPAGRFESDPLQPAFQGSTRTIAFPSVVYWMELDNRSVRKLFAAPGDEPILGAHELPPATDPTILVATKQHVYLLKSSGERLQSVSYDVDLSRNEIEAAILPNHHLLLRAQPLSPEFEEQTPMRALEYSEDGRLLHDTSVKVHGEDHGVKLARTAGFGLIHPLAGLPLHRAWLADSVFELDTQNHHWLFLSCMLAASLLSGGITLLLGRRFGFASGKLAGWTVTNLLIGPLGVVVLMGLNAMPAREVCEACKQNRLSGHPFCPSCGVPLAPPAVDGREIFEPAEAFHPALV